MDFQVFLAFLQLPSVWNRGCFIYFVVDTLDFSRNTCHFVKKSKSLKVSLDVLFKDFYESGNLCRCKVFYSFLRISHSF